MAAIQQILLALSVGGFAPPSGSSLLREDGDYVRREDGGSVLLEAASPVPLGDVLLREDGSYVLREDSGRILLDGTALTVPPNAILDLNGEAILDLNSQFIEGV